MLGYISVVFCKSDNELRNFSCSLDFTLCLAVSHSSEGPSDFDSLVGLRVSAMQRTRPSCDSVTSRASRLVSELA